MSIAAFLPMAPIARREDADTLLELAFLVTAADGVLAPEEVTALGDLLGRVRGAPSTDEEVAALYAELADRREGRTCVERVRDLAPELPPELRESAFRIAMALALVDRDASTDEDVLIGVLFESLALDRERAEVLAKEVRSALSPPLGSAAPSS